MVLNGKTMLALDSLQVEVLRNALAEYDGPYGEDWSHLGPVEKQRHITMVQVAETMAHEIDMAVGFSHAQD